MIDLANICYLCGNLLENDIDDDHVPPRQFYSKGIRTNSNLNLLTLKTHISCNKSYQLDEEYFIHTFSPLALGSFSGTSILNELLSQYKEGRNIPLSHKIFSEFDPKPSGLYLPDGKVVKRFNPNRVWRVVWKITRGLFFYEYKIFLPEATPRKYKLASPGEKPPDEFFLLPDNPIRGRYPGILDYKYMKFSDIDDFHFWAILFWDKIIALIYFHDPECCCDICTKDDKLQ